MPNYDACPVRHKELRKNDRCPYPRCLGKCFHYCDRTSDHNCSQCKWFTGDETCDGRHKSFGHCAFQIKGVSSYLLTNCPHFQEQDENWIDFDDTVEVYVLTMLGVPMYIEYAGHAFVRPLRAAIRKALLKNE